MCWTEADLKMFSDELKILLPEGVSYEVSVEPVPELEEFIVRGEIGSGDNILYITFRLFNNSDGYGETPKAAARRTADRVKYHEITS